MSLFLRLFILCILLPFEVYTYDYQFTDGNGNRYILTKEKLIALQYFPITPEISSSGTYSGGQAKSIFIKNKQYEEFLNLLKASNIKPKKLTVDRRKGTSHLSWYVKNKKKEASFSMQDKIAQRIENLLKGFLGTMTKKHDNNSLIGSKFSISREESPWLGFTGSSEEEEKGKHIRASLFPANGYVAITSPKEVVYESESLLYRNEVKKEVIIYSGYFSDLERVDATRLKAGESVSIGRVLDPKLRKADFLIPFLLKGQLVITYWHTNSELECVSASQADSKLIFRFSGTHYYYTNEKNSSNFKFNISIDMATGELSLSGE
jgi:hypothetical protein